VRHRACRWVLHILDTDPFSLSKGGWLEDVNLVEKYTISDESYNAREHTYRKFKADKMAEDPGWTIEKEMAKKRGVEYVPAYNEVRSPARPASLLRSTALPGAFRLCRVQAIAVRARVATPRSWGVHAAHAVRNHVRGRRRRGRFCDWILPGAEVNGGGGGGSRLSHPPSTSLRAKRDDGRGGLAWPRR
jgi:hypothetical protein